MHVEKNFMEVHYNILVQNHVHYKYVFHEYHVMSGGAMVKDLTPKCGGEACNLGYLGYLGDLIR